MNPPFSFDVLSRFVYHSNDVPIFSFMDLSIFFSSIYHALVMIFLYVHLVHPYHMYLI